ncbi:FAD-dependent monooxygenase [Alcaligenaceae bacterium]|nr:FAD-dependent monooxygenase [Alcaligenaceae bacterium]
MVRKVHIVGGGIGGLAVAACLAQRDWDVTVHERSAELREVGAGIFLKENSVRVLEELGCLEAITKHGSRLKRSIIRDRNGAPILARNIGAERVFTVLREDLHRELAVCAQGHGAKVRLNSDVKKVTPEGHIVTADASERADLIIGADGVGSVVRMQARLQKRAVRMPNGSTRILVPRAPSDSSDGSVEYWRGHKRVMVVPVGDDITYFCASSREDDPRGVALPFDAVYWSECFPELADIFSRVTPDMGVHHAHGLVRVSGWQRGRIAILGDAVHGQPPNLGQGAGMAIYNGHALAEFLAETQDVESALRAWEAKYFRLTEQVQNWSISWDHFVHRWPLGMEGLRSSVIWSLARFPVTGRHWGKLYRGSHEPYVQADPPPL